MRRPVLFALTLSASVLFGTAAQAQSRAATATAADSKASAIDHFKEAVALFERGEVAAACRGFEQSYAEDAAPGTLYNLALCHERQGRSGDAYRELDDLASRAEASGLTDKAASVRARANALLPKLARVDLVRRQDAIAGVTGLTIDGTSFVADTWKRPLYLTPGVHVVGIEHSDGITVTRTTGSLGAGEAQRIEMEDPAPPRGAGVNRGRRLASYVVGGSGLAVLAAGGVLGGLALHEKNMLDKLCPSNTTCTSASAAREAPSDRSTATTEATLSTVGLAVGGAALVTAVVLFVTSRQATEPAASGFLLAPSTDGHGGGFQLETRF